MEETRTVNKVLGRMMSSGITQKNNLVYAGGVVVVTERLGVKPARQINVKEPWWKRRLEGQIKALRITLSRLEQFKRGTMKKKGVKERLQSKYYSHKKVVIEELKQRIIAKAKKVKRYQGRIRRYKQNSVFVNNRHQLYKELDGDALEEQEAPDADAAVEFWTNI